MSDPVSRAPRTRALRHLDVLRSGAAWQHYGGAMKMRAARALLRIHPRHQLVFDLGNGVNGLLRRGDDLTLRAFLNGIDRPLASTLRAYLTRGMVVLDVGANTGLYTSIIAACVGPSGRVFAFEPIPYLARRVRENAELNRLTNVDVLEAAVGAEAGRSDLHLSAAGGDGWASLYAWNWSGPETLSVPILTLDDWLEASSMARVDLVKIDVEGAELDVLRGAGRSLASGKIGALIVEFNEETQSAAHHTAADLRDFLTGFGFAWYQLPWSSGAQLPVAWSELGRLCDLIAIKPDSQSNGGRSSA